MVIGGGTYAKSLKNIIAFGPEKPGIDYRIHSADEFILVSGMELFLDTSFYSMLYSITQTVLCESDFHNVFLKVVI